jgi:hypothetical protein
LETVLKQAVVTFRACMMELAFSGHHFSEATS